MLRISFYLFVSIALNFHLLLAQVVNKVLVSGDGLPEHVQHELDVKEAFMFGYGSYDNTQFGKTVEFFGGDVQGSFNYASSNGFNLIIRSYTGLEEAISIADNFPFIKIVMPSGSNTYEESFSGDVINSPVIITGAGVDHNVTGYKIEFFSIDPITKSNLSSFANGYIAGQIAYIANTLNCSIEDARLLARSTASNLGSFDYYDGFGKINITSALNAGLPVELTLFTGVENGDQIDLSWETATEVNNYGFNIERSSPSPRISWKTIGFVGGNGNSNSPKYYKYIDKNIQRSGIYNYRLKQIDNNGQFEFSRIVKINLNKPLRFKLNQNYPNPFNPVTSITFQIPVKGKITLKVFNIVGKEVAILMDDEVEPGSYVRNFNGNDLASGVYFCKLQANEFVDIKKMLLLK